jgi:hypothetical protein
MEKENKKKEKNYWKLAFIGIGLTCVIVSVINSHRVQKKLDIARGENQNLQITNKSLLRQIQNLAYQNGKLTQKRT